MVVNSYRPLWGMIQGLWLPMLPIFGYVLLVSWADIRYHLEDFNFPFAVITVLGTVIGLLLAFRTNSSYARWWEARIIWGAIVNDSRTWVRQLTEFSSSVNEPSPAQKPMAYRQIAWCYALSRSLRAQDPTQDLDAFLASDEIEIYDQTDNVPNRLLLRQAIELRRLYDSNQIELFQFIELEKTLTRLTNSMGGCERIRNTVFPTSYSRLVYALIYLFVAFLPLGLVSVPEVGLIVTSLSLAFAFLLIDRVAVYLQDPFRNRPSDTPMMALSRTIEINIKEMLGEQNLPDPAVPVRGILN